MNLTAFRSAAVTVAAGLATACAAGPSFDVPEDLVVPAGMIVVPGGRTVIGEDNRMPDEGPPFEIDVPPFLLDIHPVTVAQFGEFVAATGYVTEAEKFGDAAVMEANGAWTLIQGATWQHPRGPDLPAAEDDHPVTQVSWNDAVAYAEWKGNRLPTEVEWEHAARGGVNNRERYSWGSELIVDGEFKANTWTGTFPVENTVEDGFRYTAPVGEFGKTALGLTDMGGNIWEWTSDWYRPYAERTQPFNPTSSSEKVQRGGSFLCHTSYCHGYRVSARSHSTPETSLFHVGFRTARSIQR